MPIYKIYHPANDTRTPKENVSFHPDSDKFTLNWQQLKRIPFTKVAEVEADSLEEAWSHAQNGIHANDTYTQLGIRSTSVGDIIQTPEGGYHFVEGQGFSVIDNPQIV